MFLVYICRSFLREREKQRKFGEGASSSALREEEENGFSSPSFLPVSLREEYITHTHMNDCLRMEFFF